MSTYASRIWRATNLENNSRFVEWRTLGQKPQSALCESVKAFRALRRKLTRNGYININSL